jgi:hypothetical protein
MLLKKTKLKTAFDIIKISSRARDSLTNLSDQQENALSLFFCVDFERFTRLMSFINAELSANQVASMFKIIDSKKRKVLGLNRHKIDHPV